ncbi:glycosyltransferase family 2 protein [Elusimicrobiota bacterium]
MDKLTIVIPAYNEEKNIGSTLESLKGSVDPRWLVLVVNDHSKDRTREIAESRSNLGFSVKVMDNPLEQGYAWALKAGLESVDEGVVVIMMADLCDDPRALTAMYEKISQGYDVVCASRYSTHGARLGGSRVKGFLSRSAGWLVGKIIGVNTRDATNAYKMFRVGMLKKIDIEPASFATPMEILLKFHFAGARASEVPTVWKERSRGESYFIFRKVFKDYLYWFSWAIYKRILKALSPSGVCRNDE